MGTLKGADELMKLVHAMYPIPDDSKRRHALTMTDGLLTLVVSLSESDWQSFDLSRDDDLEKPAQELAGEIFQEIVQASTDPASPTTGAGA